MSAEAGSARKRRRGFVIGELLVAVLLLAVAVSSLAALMYSVSRRPEPRESAVCSAKASEGSSKCAPRVTAGGGEKVLRSTCVTKDGTVTRGCVDSAPASGETILKTKTDSASAALVAKRQKAGITVRKPYQGFIR
jgi:Tfp pilus assembly protein PilV